MGVESKKFFKRRSSSSFSPALITPLPASIFPNKIAPNVSNNILRNPPFSSFVSSFVVSLTPFNNNTESSRDLTIF